MSAEDTSGRDRYQQLASLFHRALDLPPVERDAFVRSVKESDAGLGTELESLIGASHRAEGFMDRPVLSGIDPRPAPLPPLPAGPIGPYRLLSVIGEGGMGVVYLAEDTRLGRTVALKALRSEFDGDETRRARLRREARTAAALVHPNVATIYALEEIENRLYLASEFVAGETLRSEIGRAPMATRRAARLALAIARALEAAHARGIVHRDLKPENIVTTADDGLKVLDFGLARGAETDGHDGLTKDGTALGTPAYMSPEQIRGARLDGRSDLFAWGVIVVELLTGRHPFVGATPAATIARVLEERPSGLHTPEMIERRRADSLANSLATLAERCLAKDASDRPHDAAEIVGLLEPALAGERGSESDVAAEALASAPTTRAAAAAPATWWWQFHQATTTIAYGLLLYPLFRLRSPGDDISRVAFLAALVAVVVAGMLRLHLWFALRQYNGDWLAEHATARRLVRAADITLAVALGTQGLRAVARDESWAMILVAAAASVVVSFFIIEPATAKAMKSALRADLKIE